MRPAIFWNVQEKVKFLRALHRFLYKHDDNGVMRAIATANFREWLLWSIRLVKLLEIYDHNPDMQYGHLSMPLLWRSA